MTYRQALIEAGRAVDTVESLWGTDAGKVPAGRFAMWLRVHERWQVLVNLMDDEIREMVHMEDCSGYEGFADCYLTYDSSLGDVEAF